MVSYSVVVETVFRALADPTRRALLDALFEQDGQTLVALTAGHNMTRIAVAKHLRLLEDAGLVVSRRHGREKLHFLNTVPIRLIHDRWVSKYTEPWVAGLRAISFDFGNTLVPVRREDFRVVVTRMTTDIAGRSGPFRDGSFETAWLEEGQRQFAEDVPRMQEVDLAQRTIRVLARLRGMPTPEPTSATIG